MASVDAYPRSASLDLLRSPTVSPLPVRASFESVSTLRGHRISSPIFLNSSVGVRPQPQDEEPKTPRHETSDHLRSKFSMSPLQPSKQSKARVSQDPPCIARLEAKTTIGHWSHSLGAAARRLQNTLARRGDAVATVKIDSDSNEVTPDKKALKGAASFASIRRLITPSRRTRKVSAAPRLAVPRSAIVEVEQGPEPGSAAAHDDAGWMDAEGSVEGGARPRSSETAELHVDTSPPGSSCATRPGNRCSKSSSVSDQGVTQSASADVLARRATNSSDQNSATVIARHDAESMHSITHEVLQDDFSLVGDRGTERDQTSKTWSGPPPPAPSKLKTLQLLARRPFHAFGRKMREMDVSWWPRSSQDEANSQPPTSQCTVPAFALRRSEDLLSKASPRVCPLANPSRSLDQDRIQLPSKVVPILSTGTAVYKRRPNIPEAFVRQVPASAAQPRPLERTTMSAPLLAPRISNNRHPWMKQLHLSNNLAAQADAITEPSLGQDQTRSVAKGTTDAKVAVPKLSLTAAEDAVHMPMYGSSRVVDVEDSACRRPPASLLGQSLPIPPRGGRRRASTISSQSSSVSSPSGKVIVSRRSYGQRSRSPGCRERAGSIRSVGTSILFGETPPGTPGLRRMLSPQISSGSPSRGVYARRPSKVVLVPKYSPARHRQAETGLQRKPSSSFTADSEQEEEQEWVDEAPANAKRLDLVALRSKIEAALPAGRPGFLEMSEATDTLSYLVKTFNGSSGSLVSNSSPFKTGALADPTSPRDLYGIAEADEINLPRRSACYLGGRTRVRLTSKASLVSTEANSSFEDSEELQKLLDSIMATDLGNSCDTSGSQGDMALLSPFGSPADRPEPCGDAGCASESRSRATPRSSPMPPPPKFLLNDRPISPPDSTNMSECMHTSASDDPCTAPQPPPASKPFELAPASLCRTASWSSATSQAKISRVPVATLSSHHAQRQPPFTSRL